MRTSNLAARFLVAALLIGGGVGSCVQPAQARLPPVAGERCLDSILLLQMDLPFSDISHGADIVDIHGFMPPEGGVVVGFIYTTRRGDLFMQVERKNFDAASAALRSVGAVQLANAAQFGRPAGAIFPVRTAEAVGLLGKLRRRQQLYPCFTNPLS